MKSYNFNKSIQIQDHDVGEGRPVFVIAEAGVNHFGDIGKAINLVDLAVKAKADAFKIQVFNTDNLVSREAESWKERLKPKELTSAEVLEIKRYCQEQGILFLATAHEKESLDFVASLDLPAFKIGSGEVNNPDFIREVAEKQRPVILSTGMYTLEEIGRTLEIIFTAENRNVIVLHCVTLYPSPASTVNLRAMDTIRKEFDVLVGYSDHTESYDIPLAAVARGACMIEKHITLDRNVPNAQDWKVSCGYEDFPLMIASIRKIEAALGTGLKIPHESELESKKWARKSLVAKKDIPAGARIRKEMLCSKRPGTGISPDEIDTVVGMRTLDQIAADDLLNWDLLKSE